MALQSSSRFGVGPRFGLEVLGVIGALAAGVGIGALVFDTGSDEPSSVAVSQAPAVSPPRVSSAPGPAELSQSELVAAEKAIHDAYMDAMFGTYPARVASAPGPAELSPAEWLATQKAVHDQYMDEMFGAYVSAASTVEFDVGAARDEHDRLIPVTR